MLFTRTTITDLVGTCLDKHVQIMSRKACQKRKDHACNAYSCSTTCTLLPGSYMWIVYLFCQSAAEGCSKFPNL